MTAAAPLLALLLSAAPTPLDLPAPFKDVRAEDVMRALYPQWDPVTLRLGAERPSPVRPRHLVENAELWGADVWLEEKPADTWHEPKSAHLLALVSTWKYLPGAAPLEERDPRTYRGPLPVDEQLCDVAVLDHEQGKLAVKAHLVDAVPCGRGAVASLVVEPKQAGTRPAFGVRVERSETDPSVTLYLIGRDARGAYRVLEKRTLETTVKGAWRTLVARVARGQTVRLRGTTSLDSTVVKLDFTDHRILKEAPLDALVCRIGASRHLEIGAWPKEEDHPELTLTLKAEQDGPLQCLLNDNDAARDGAYVELLEP